MIIGRGPDKKAALLCSNAALVVPMLAPKSPGRECGQRTGNEHCELLHYSEAQRVILFHKLDEVTSIYRQNRTGG